MLVLVNGDFDISKSTQQKARPHQAKRGWQKESFSHYCFMSLLRASKSTKKSILQLFDI